jgi:hypothetical protein
MTRTITEPVAEILGDAILCNPRTGHRLITHEAMHKLMHETGGLVILRGRAWTFRFDRADEAYVRLSLREA